MQSKSGLYVGTHKRGRGWQRYAAGGFFARGSGKMWTDERGIYFHRHLTAEPLFVAWSQVQAIESGSCHAGRWAWGLPIIKVCWKANGEDLGSGFMVSGRRAAQLEALDALRREHAACAAARH